MAKESLAIQRFDGGMSNDDKSGPPYSFAYARHIDFRKSPTQMTVLPETVKESGSIVTGLVTNIIQLPSGKLIGIDTSGGVYSRSTSGTWTKNGTAVADTACGLIYNEQYDTVYIPGSTRIHAITNADGKFSGGTFTVNSNYLTQSSSIATIVSTNTYTTTNNITETATHMLLYTPTVSPIGYISIRVTTKGTGNLVLTLHDATNNLIDTVTILNASLNNGVGNNFIYTSPVKLNLNSTYHFHITHPSGTASTIGTGTASSFATARYSLRSNQLTPTTNGFHPATQFMQYICIGNGRYLAVWEVISQQAPAETEFLPHRLSFPEGYEVTSMAIWTEYLAIACEKRSTSAGNEYQDGKIFFWDGTSQTYNFSLDIPEGAPYSLYSHKNVLNYFANGVWYAWSGGNPVKIVQIPSSDTEFGTASSYTINNPNMLAVRNGILLAGYPSLTSSTTIEHGVYSFGARDRSFSESFGLSYTLSTGNLTNGTLQIGCVRSFGDKLFVSWKDSSNYGIDLVSPVSDPNGTATWESLILDDNAPSEEKSALKIVIDFVALPTGCTVIPKYKINRGSWVTGDTAVAGDTQIRQNINKRYKELQVGLDITCTTSTPTIYGVTIVRDLLISERK